MKNALGFFKEPLGVPLKQIGESALKTFYGELHKFILDIFGDRKGLL